MDREKTFACPPKRRDNQGTNLEFTVVPWSGSAPCPCRRHLPLTRPALHAQGDEEEENLPPPYKYEGPRDDGASLEISVTIEPEEGAEEGAEKKVRTKAITLLGARKGPGGKAAYPNGDGFEGGYFAGKRHGAAGSYTHAAMSITSWLSLRPAGSPEASCSACNAARASGYLKL